MPELLRTVPDPYAARIGSDIWTVSTRGFADRFSNPWPVMSEGRRIDVPVRSLAPRARPTS